MSLLDLRKQKVLELKKRKWIDGKATIVVAMDYSWSMESLYRDGTVQSIVERLFPLALEFDDNGMLDFYLFHDSYRKLKPVTIENYKDYVDKNVTWEMGWTEYSPVLNAIYQDNFVESKLFGLMKSKKKVSDPVYVIFITDWDNRDHNETTELMQEISVDPMFIQFVWIGKSWFHYLEKLDDMKGRAHDNCDFFSVSNINSVSDDGLYENLLNEFPKYIQEVRAAGLIK